MSEFMDRRERGYEDQDPDPEYFDEMEETYADGSLKNECWNSGEAGSVYPEE